MGNIRIPDAVRKPDAETAEPQLQRPPMYRVIMLNDDFTPMDFVVELLVTYFQKSHEQATEIMLTIHYRGRGLCGIYPFEIAESKVACVERASRQAGHPLRCVIEKSDSDES